MTEIGEKNKCENGCSIIDIMQRKKMPNKKYSGGFIGLLALLICVAIIAILIVRSDLFSGNKDGKNTIEQGMDAIDAAKNAKNLIEQHTREAVGQ